LPQQAENAAPADGATPEENGGQPQ